MVYKKWRRIIQRMKKIYNIYRLVKLVDVFVEEKEKENPSPLKNSGVDLWHPGTAYVKAEFVKKYKRITRKQATEIVADSISKEYLKGYTRKHRGVDLDILCVAEGGRDLLDTVPGLPFLKIGLYEALWAKHGKIITGLIGLIIGSIPTIIWLVARIIDSI